MKKARAFSVRIYRVLSQAFPADFRRAHGQDLLQTTEDLIGEVAQREGLRRLIFLMCRILVDLLLRIPAEHAAELRQDLRYAFRMLALSPGFTLAAVLSVGCGIGMGTSVFSQLNAFIFEPVPAVVASPQLVSLRNPVSFPVYEAFRDRSNQFSEVAAYLGPVPMASNDSRPEVRVWGQFVTPNYFQVLGTRAQLGRTFTSEEEKGIEPLAVISDRFWREQMGTTQDIVGQTIRLNGKLVTVIGVAAAEFQGASPLISAADIWIPVTVHASFAPELGGNVLQDSRQETFSVVGRLRPEIPHSEAEASLDTIVKQLNDTGPDDPASRGRQVVLLPGARRLPVRDSDLPAVVAVPTILVGLMLWIACSNVGTILLARSQSRRKEIAIRLSLGASRSRLVRQLLTESVTLALLGGTAGFLLAVWIQRWSERSLKDFAPGFVNLNISLDWRALLFTFGLSLLSGVLFGLAPAMQATRGDLAQCLKRGSNWRLGGFRWFGTRNIMVLQQVVGSLMLILLTGFVVLGVGRTSSIDPGFDPRNLYMMSVDPLRDGYSGQAATEWLSQVRDRVKQLPGVMEASLCYAAPIGPRSSRASVRIKSDFDSIQQALRSVQVEQIGLGFFETAGLGILHGRSFVDKDAGQDRVIVNETMARQTWPNQDPLERDIELNGKHDRVVGVVRDMNGGGIFEIPQPAVFRLMTSEDYQRPSPHGTTLLIRGRPGVDILSLIRKEFAVTDPQLTIFNTTSVQDEIDRQLYVARATMYIYGGMGLFGLVLAAVGLAGVTSYAVVQRTKEIGIRVALGATRLDVLRLVTREGAMLVIVGTVIGQFLAYALTRLLSSWFNTLGDITKTSTTDPLLLVGAPVLLAALTMLACYLPARRSIRIDPAITLREE
jgi:predicted permease